MPASNGLKGARRIDRMPASACIFLNSPAGPAHVAWPAVTLCGDCFGRSVSKGSGGYPRVDIAAPIQDTSRADPNERRATTIAAPSHGCPRIDAQQAAEVGHAEEFGASDCSLSSGVGGRVRHTSNSPEHTAPTGRSVVTEDDPEFLPLRGGVCWFFWDQPCGARKVAIQPKSPQLFDATHFICRY